MSSFLRPVLVAGLVALLFSAHARAGACSSGPSTLCLQGDRFQVTAEWVEGAQNGDGLVVGPTANDLGFLRYDDDETVEVMAKVLDSCMFTGTYWVQLANLSNFGQTITVTDLNLGTQVDYTVTEGTYGQPVIDTASFPCTAPFGPPFGSEGAPGRIIGATTLLLEDGRFRAETTWDNGAGTTGDGEATSLFDRAGHFTFFSPSNPVMVMKMAPGDGGFYSVVTSSITNVAYELTVTDLCSGETQVYNQPLNNTLTIADEEAFAIECPLIFGDGFENGDLAAWSLVVGGP